MNEPAARYGESVEQGGLQYQSMALCHSCHFARYSASLGSHSELPAGQLRHCATPGRQLQLHICAPVWIVALPILTDLHAGIVVESC